MNISIIIPNYNGEKLLKNNLPKVLHAVKDYNKGKIEIIIPDDPSTDNSQKVIKEFIASIQEKHIVGKTIENRNKKQAGFSKNVNRGVNLSTGDILLLLNTDVIPHKGFLDPLLQHFADEKVFAVGCMDQSIEGAETVLRGRGIGKWQRGFFMHTHGDLTKENTLWVAGGSGAFRKSIWTKLRGLDVLYNPFYWEDIDLSYRALKSGYKLFFERDSVVVHEHEKGAIRTKFKEQKIKAIAYRNQFIFIWKNITDGKFLFLHIWWLPYHLLKALFNRDWPFFIGFYNAFIRLSQIMHARFLAKKLFVRKDAEILKQFSS